MPVKFSEFAIGTINADLEIVGFNSATPTNVQVSYTDIKNDILASAISGSGVTGQVAYWNGTNSQTGSNNLFWDAANARLGIGTNVPGTNKVYISHNSGGPAHYDNSSLFLYGDASNIYIKATTAGTTLGTAYMYMGNNNAIGLTLFSTHNEFGFRYGTSDTIIHYRPSWYWKLKLGNQTIPDTSRQTAITSFGNASSNVLSIFGTTSQSGTLLDIHSNATDASKVFQLGATGNLILQNGGTFTDGGQRLQVYGDAFIKGSGATSATSALLIQNSAGGRTLEVLNNGRLIVDDTAGTQTLQINGTAQSQGIAIGTANTFATANGSGAVAIGRAASAAGGQSVAIGIQSSSAGEFGVAIGYLSVASSQRGIAIGFQASTAGWTNSIAFNGQATGTGQFVAGGAGTITDVFFGSGPRTFNTNGTSYTINGSGGATSIGNTNGGNITIAGGKGVGSGASGDVIISTATPTTSGSTLQTLTERIKVFGATGNVVLQNGGTFLDGGFRLDVNGTARVSGNLTLGTTPTIQSTTGNIIISSVDVPSRKLTYDTTNNTLAFTQFGTQAFIGERFYSVSDPNTFVSPNGLNSVGSAKITAYDSSGNAAITASNNGNRSIVLNGLGSTGSVLIGAITTGNGTSYNAILRADSTTQGFLPPRMTTTQKNAIATPSAGLQVYDTTLNQMSYYNGTTWINF